VVPTDQRRSYEDLAAENGELRALVERLSRGSRRTARRHTRLAEHVAALRLPEDHRRALSSIQPSTIERLIRSLNGGAHLQVNR
jgi:hypothetical protein